VAAEIEKAFGVQPQLVRGSGGIFQVRVGDRVIFDKHETQRFLEDGEVIELLKAI
jgi:co-chaperonin GroES (HSP10)